MCLFHVYSPQFSKFNTSGDCDQIISLTGSYTVMTNEKSEGKVEKYLESLYLFPVGHDLSISEELVMGRI